MKGKTVLEKIILSKPLFSLKLPSSVTISWPRNCFLGHSRGNHESITKHTGSLMVPSFVVINLVL